MNIQYWFWKNLLSVNDHRWIGFCQKRRYWIKDEYLAGKAHKSPFKLGINIGLSLFTFGWWIPVLIILYILHRRKFK